MLKNSNSFEALNSTTFVFQITGLQYFGLNNINSRSSCTKFNCGIFFLIVFLLAYAFSYLPLLESRENGDENVQISLTFDALASLLMILAIIAIMIQSYTSTMKTKHIYSNLEKVSKICSKYLHTDLDYAHVCKEFKTMICWILLMFSSMLSVVLILYYLFCSKEMMWNISFEIVLHFFLLILVFRFVFYVILVKFHAQTIEEFLDIFQHNKNEMIELEKFKWTLPSRTVNRDFVTIEALMALKKVYGIVFQTSKLINQICGFSNLIIIGLILSSDVLEGYNLYLATKNDIPMIMIIGSY